MSKKSQKGSEEGGVRVPLDVPEGQCRKYADNYREITRGSDRLMLFAADQKVEHLNDDFFGPGICPEDADPEHMFRIASRAKIGAFATQLGLIARYGADYSEVPYVVKLNSKTHLVKVSQSEPFSPQWIDIDQVEAFREDRGLNILGVGYTIYLGSEREPEMLREAAQVVYRAHRIGLVTILWIYPRGKAVKDEKDPHLIAGAAGVAAALGTDFVKVNCPSKAGASSAEIFREAVAAAGRTKVVCAGGGSMDVREFLQRLHDQIHISGAAGNATGRNIHQRSLRDAVGMANAIYAITVEDKSVDEAMEVYAVG